MTQTIWEVLVIINGRTVREQQIVPTGLIQGKRIAECFARKSPQGSSVELHKNFKVVFQTSGRAEAV